MVVQKCVRLLGLMVLLLITGITANAATLETEVDRETVIDGESIVLYISGTGLSGIPDTSVLLPSFRIVQSGVSSSQQVINGQSTRGFKVRLELQSKNTGAAVIPAFTVDGASSNPITITVVPRGTPGVEPRDKVFVELSVDNETPYVQEQVVLSLKIFDDGNLASADPSLVGNSDYQIERLPSAGEQLVKRDGEEYRVHTFRYAMFPQKSGELVIDAISIPASVRDKSYGGNVILRNTPTRRIELQSNALPIQVKPRAEASTSGWWLPVKELQLKHEWSADIQKAKSGEAFTLTLELLADGATSTQLPEVVVPEVPGLKIYTDSPKFGSQAEQDSVVSLRQEKWSVIPSASGDITLPEIQVKWWDTVNDTEQVASIPAQVISVQGQAPAVSPNTTGSATSNTEALALNSADLTKETTSGVTAEPSDGQVLNPATDESVASQNAESHEHSVAYWWQWLALAAMAVWAITLLVWWITSRRTRASTVQAKQIDSQSQTQAWNKLKAASKKSDVAAYSVALLEWGQARWPHHAVHNLPTVGTLLGSRRVTDQLSQLDRMRFSPQHDEQNSSAVSIPEVHHQLELAIKEDRQTDTATSHTALPQL